MKFLIKNQSKISKTLKYTDRLDFITESWRNLVVCKKDKNCIVINRREFEICVFSNLMGDIKSGDIFIEGSENYGDYRSQLIPWIDCEKILDQYCKEVNLPNNKIDFVMGLKNKLKDSSKFVDKNFKDNDAFSLDENGIPTLKRFKKKVVDPKAQEIEELIMEKMPERNLLDMICNTEHWLNWSKHFNPIGGSNTKIDNPRERYILTSFAYGTNLGPTQTSKHLKNPVPPNLIRFINRKHIDSKKLDGAIKEIINGYSAFTLPKI